MAMKGADIEVGAVYLAEVAYGTVGKAEVLEKGVEMSRPYGPTRRNGVRVKLLAEASRRMAGETTYPEGREFLVTSRDVRRPWTADDDKLREVAAAERRRAVAIGERLDALGVKARVDGRSASMTHDAVERLLDAAEAER